MAQHSTAQRNKRSAACMASEEADVDQPTVEKRGDEGQAGRQRMAGKAAATCASKKGAMTHGSQTIHKQSILQA